VSPDAGPLREGRAKAGDAALSREAAPDKGPRRRLTARPWWPTAKRTLAILFLLGVLVLVVDHARSVDWPAVWRAIRAYPVRTLLLAGGLAAASHALYCSYDLIGRQQTGHPLPARRVVGVGFVSYAFNLNLGSLVGGVALRYRLYSRLGLGVDVVTKILVLSLLTNWLGYLFLSGLLFLVAPLPLPLQFGLAGGGLRLLGAGLLLLAAAYVGLCFGAKRREWHLRGHAVRLPPGRIAVLQLALSTVNWMLIGAVVWVLLQRHADYPTVLSVLLIAAVAGVVAHVPAGLGVLEGVFVLLLAPRVPQPELIAALLAYRGLYYLVPLAIAVTLYLVFDVRGRKGGSGVVEAHAAARGATRAG
jgi:hypothetical protein